MTAESDAIDPLLRRAAAGDSESWAVLAAQHSERLRRVVAFRLDPRLRGRLDPEDVVQDVLLAAWEGLADYLAEPRASLFLWLRGIAANKLLELHRRHLGTPMRDVRREVALHRNDMPEATSAELAARLLDGHTGPSEAAARAEAKVRLQEALDRMGTLDREVLALRHFEHLTAAEAARVLGVTEAAAGKRYLRALERLRDLLGILPGGIGGA